MFLANSVFFWKYKTEETSSKGWGKLVGLLLQSIILILCVGCVVCMQFVHPCAGASTMHENVEVKGQHWMSSSIALPLKSSFYFYFMCMSVLYFICMSMCITCTQCPRRPEDSMGSPGTGTDSYMGHHVDAGN